MLTERGFAALRGAATLTHMLPSLSTKVFDGDREVIEVSWPPAAPPPAGVLDVHPCAFRQGVVEAWTRDLAGDPMQFLDLTGDPTVELRTTAGGAVYPSGVVRVPVFDEYVYAFASTLEPQRCRQLCDDLLPSLRDTVTVSGVGVRGDAETQITVVHADVIPEPIRLDEAVINDTFEQCIARLAATELIDRLSGDGVVG